jgi:hypothetical protein
MPIGPRRKLLAVSVIALASLAAITLLPSGARANGRVAEYVRQVAGPYEVALGTVPNRPVVGALHMTMTVTEISSETLVLDAEVVVIGTGPEPEEGVEAVDVGPIEALVNATSLGFYDVNTSVDRAGAWRFTVDVTAGPGDASTVFAMDVKKASGAFRLLTWVTVVVFFALVGLGLLPMIRERSRRRSGRSNK